MFALLPASCLGLLFAVLEFLVMLPDEVNLIWTRPFRLTLPKFLYAISRYFGLVAHALHVALSWRVVSHFPIPDHICRQWLCFQIIVTFILLNAMDLTLLLRVYAFYRRGRQIGVLLAMLFIIRFVLATSSVIISPPSQPFDEHCKPQMPTIVVFCFLITEMITQSIILGLTFAKQFISSRDTRAYAPITRLLYRDGILTYGAVFAVLIAILVYAKLGLLRDFASFIFPIFISILSSSTCRMILNMQSLAAEIPTVDTIELTDVLESIGDTDGSSS